MQDRIYELNSKIDFTLLDARATQSDIEKLCDIAYKNKYYSVCVNSSNVQFTKGYITKNFGSDIKVTSVAGFPLGASSIDVKCFEIKNAIENGADEIDFVVNVGKVKEGDYNYIKNEFSKIRKISKGHILKCIFETCYLDENEIIKLCRLCMKCKIDFVKTSTGFGTSGANEEVVSLMVRECSGNCAVKASGGIHSREDAIKYLNLGAERIGTSRVL